MMFSITHFISFNRRKYSYFRVQLFHSINPKDTSCFTEEEFDLVFCPLGKLCWQKMVLKEENFCYNILKASLSYLEPDISDWDLLTVRIFAPQSNVLLLDFPKVARCQATFGKLLRILFHQLRTHSLEVVHFCHWDCHPDFPVNIGLRIVPFLTIHCINNCMLKTTKLSIYC